MFQAAAPTGQWTRRLWCASGTLDGGSPPWLGLQYCSMYSHLASIFPLPASVIILRIHSPRQGESVAAKLFLAPMLM